MKHYFITGTSRGIGRALAELILTKKNTRVTGISRSNTLTHLNFSHISLSLSDPNNAASFKFPELEEAEEIILINNAGIISEIKRIGQQKNTNIINDYNVNIVSPSILTNNFVKTYQNYTNKRSILNISSGAGRHTVDAWSIYCSAKAALDMFSKNISAEQSVFPKENRINIFSVAPGVIDTAMQEQIRDTSEKDFSDVKKFINLKNDNMLFSPKQTAELLLKIINGNYLDVILDVREL